MCRKNTLMDYLIYLFQLLMKDVLRPFVPEYKGQVTCEDGERILFELYTYI